jgi:hypothetical protein
MELVIDMMTDGVWQNLYRAALLELRPEQLRMRIDEAEKAILQRVVELRHDDNRSEEESQALDDALRGLRVLESTECKLPSSTLSGLAQDGRTI